MNPNTFSALAEPNRFNIVEYLQSGPHSVNEISTRLKLNQPQTSKHLKVLSNAGVVEVHPVKQQRVYKLSPKRFQELDGWISSYTKIWNIRFNRLDSVLTKMQRKEVKHGRQ